MSPEHPLMLSFNAMVWIYRCSFSSTWRSKERSATTNTEGGQRNLWLYAIHLEIDQETCLLFMWLPRLNKTGPLWSQLAFPMEPLTGQDSASDVINLDRNSFDQWCIGVYTPLPIPLKYNNYCAGHGTPMHFSIQCQTFLCHADRVDNIFFSLTKL